MEWECKTLMLIVQFRAGGDYIVHQCIVFKGDVNEISTFFNALKEGTEEEEEWKGFS